MTQEEKQLLIKDLCARLPYGVIVAEFDKHDNQIRKFTLKMIGDCGYLEYDAGRNGEQSASLYSKVTSSYCKPYLRPISSMTEEELFNYKHLDLLDYSNDGFEMPNFRSMDWLNAHHFDFRNLIEKGLAIKAPEDMYKI